MADRPEPANPREPITAEIAGTRLTVIEEGPAKLELILRLIDEAQESVRLLFYMFSCDVAGEAVRDALVRAAKRGLEVKLLVDKFGCSAVTADFFKPVEDAGGHFCVFHPSLGRRYLLRNHQKLAVIDGDKVITGGSNIAEQYFRAKGPRWRDLWILVEGAAARHAVRYFEALFKWTTAKGSRIRTLQRMIRRHTQRKGAIRWQFSGPMRRRNPWPTEVAKEIIGGTRLDLISAYFSPPYAMLRRIARLGRRGKVRIVTAAKSDNNATIAAARFTYKRLLRNKVEMYEYQPTKLHTKLVIVDDVVHIGSSNFDFRSLYLNLEVMLRIDDADFAAKMRGYFERELEDCLEITPQLHKARASLFRRIKWTLSNFLVTTMDYTVTRRLNFGVEK